MPEGLSPDERIDLGADDGWEELNLDIAAERRRKVLKEPYYEAARVRELLDTDDLVSLIEEGVLLAYEDHGDLLFPAFQFDLTTHQPREIVRRINVMLDAANNNWDVARWWIQINNRLPGKMAPKHVLSDEGRQDVLLELAESSFVLRFAKN